MLGARRGDVKNENSSNVFGHQLKSGHFQCKTQIRQNNWVGTPCKGPNPYPIYRGKCARGQKFRFLISTSNYIMWPLIWKLMLHWFLKKTDFKNSLLNIYTPWKLLHHFICWGKNNSCKENEVIAFRLQTGLSLKLLNSSENGFVSIHLMKVLKEIGQSNFNKVS